MKGIILTILIIVITLTEALGQFLLSIHHHYSMKNMTHYFGIPIFTLPFITWSLYGLCTYLLMHSYKYTSMGKAEIYWDALSALIVPIIGFVYFRNEINNVGWCGIALIIIGTLMISNESKIKKML